MKFRTVSKVAIRYIYILYFMCQITSIILTCLYVFGDQRVNTLWLAVALPTASVMALGLYMRQRAVKKKSQDTSVLHLQQANAQRSFLDRFCIFLFTTNIGLLLLSLISATGQSLSLKAVCDIYYDITMTVSQTGQYLILAFAIVIFLLRGAEMYLCKEAMRTYEEDSGYEYYEPGTWRDWLRQSLHTCNFAISMGLNSFLTVMILITMGYHNTMSLQNYYICLVVCIGIGVVLSLMETLHYTLTVLTKQKSTSVATVTSNHTKSDSFANKPIANIDSQDLNEETGLESTNQDKKQRTKDSEGHKDRVNIALSMLTMCF